MESVTSVQIRDFAIVAIAIMGFIVLLGNVIKTIKDWSKPGMSEKEWRRSVDESLTDNSDRIEALESGNKVIMGALVAMLSHEINGNSVDKMREALDKLNEYLINR